jgi:pimeloyl-ACP methyl ester carboxylesterase
MSMETTVEVPQGRLFVEDVGEGPVVTLLHPGLWDRRTWDPQMQLLQDEGFRVIRYDQRGYGRSDPPEPGVAFSAVRDLEVVLDAREVSRTALVGCSMGGSLAIDATLTFPDRVWALVPIASGLGGVEPTQEEIDWYGDIGDRYDAAIAAGDFEQAQMIDLAEVWATLGLEDEAGSTIRSIAQDNLAAMSMDESGKERLDPPAAERLHEIDVPTLVLTAEADPPDMDRLSALIAQGVRGAQAIRIEGADHVVNVRQPERFNAAVIPFLQTHAPR